MPRQLPFVIAPQRVSEIVEIGTPDSGVLKFLKLGTVRVAEEAEMSDDLFRQTELALKVNRLLTKLMKETGKTREEIAEFLNDTTADPELSVRYEQEIAGVMDLSTGLNTQYSQVTCMLRHRVFRPELLEGNPTPEDLNQHCGIPEWTREDTLALNKNLFNAILQFATSEINGEPSKKKDLSQETRELEAIVEAGPTDWAEYYWLIRSSAIGHDTRFSPERFGLQPVWLVNQAAQFVLEQERQRINTESVAVSKFAAALFNSLNTKKSKSSEIEFSLFLPFKWDAKGGKAKLTTESAIVLQRLLAQNRIPRRVIGALGAVGILQESAELLKQK